MVRLRVPRGIASLIVLSGTLAAIVLLLILAGQQIARGGNNLSQQVVKGLDEVRAWLMTGPLHASENQISAYIESAQDAVTASNAQVFDGFTKLTSTLSHVVAGGFIVVFATYFFLADGNRIWSWVVGLFPRAARQGADSSGRIAWASLTAFVRATVVIAVVDAIGVVAVAWVLKLPFIFAIGVLVFVGAFIPIVGALFSGMVAVMVALVDQGPVVALIMLGGVGASGSEAVVLAESAGRGSGGSTGSGESGTTALLVPTVLRCRAPVVTLSQAFLIAETSNSRVIFSLTRTPPVSRAAFQLTP